VCLLYLLMLQSVASLQNDPIRVALSKSDISLEHTRKGARQGRAGDGSSYGWTEYPTCVQFTVNEQNTTNFIKQQHTQNSPELLQRSSNSIRVLKACQRGITGRVEINGTVLPKNSGDEVSEGREKKKSKTGDEGMAVDVPPSRQINHQDMNQEESTESNNAEVNTVNETEDQAPPENEPEEREKIRHAWESGLEYIDGEFFEKGRKLSAEEVKNLPFTLFEDGDINPVITEKWMEINMKNVEMMIGRIKKDSTKGSAITTTEELLEELGRALGEQFIKDQNKVDTLSIRLTSEGEVGITVGGVDAAKTVKERTEAFINWTQENKNIVGGATIPIFGSICKKRYTETTLRETLENKIKETCKTTPSIRGISFRDHVTTIFCGDMDTALLITGAIWSIKTEKGDILTLKYNMNKATKEKAICMKATGLPTAPLMAYQVKTLINQKINAKHKEGDEKWKVILVELMRSKLGTQLDYMYIYPQQNVDAQKALEDLKDLQIAKKTLKVTMIQKRDGEG